MLDQMMRMLEGQQINSYRLNKFLGAGSFGGVFHASEMVRNTSVQEVAVKVIPESSDDKLIELQNARKLEHSNLIKAYSVGEFTFLNTEMLYLVMELAQGSLENHIAKGSLSSSEIKNITAQVAQGLNYLHGQNKVHRDLKPGNILKVNQQYKLADFGLIRTLNNKSHTQTVHNSGTIIYMPPEAFRGDISSAWDLWSLGIMLIEMTTNQLPYKFNNDINQLMAKVMNCELQIPSLPKEFKPIIEGCLQKDRRQRWTAQQVLNALQPVGWNSPPSPQQVQAIDWMPETQLKTANADCGKLNWLLAQGQWKEADQETAFIMGKIYDLYGHYGLPGKDNYKLFYCFCFPLNCDHLEKEIREVVKIIDNLWVKHSKNHFGFSVQKSIWIECKGVTLSQVNDDFIYHNPQGKLKYNNINNPYYLKSVKKFSNCVGWRNWLKGLLDYSSLTFSLNAPRGHLPRLAWMDEYLQEYGTVGLI